MDRKKASSKKASQVPKPAVKRFPPKQVAALPPKFKKFGQGKPPPPQVPHRKAVRRAYIGALPNDLFQPVPITKNLNLPDVVLVAQLVTGHMLEKFPLWFTQPNPATTNATAISPTEFAAYLMLYFFQRMNDLQQINNPPAGVSSSFKRSYHVPKSWAKFVQYYLRHHKGDYKYETFFSFVDLTLPNTQIDLSSTNFVNSLTGTNLSVLQGCASDFPGVQFNMWTQATSALCDVARVSGALSYTGLYTGNTPFSNNAALIKQINDSISTTQIGVAYEDVGFNAPDASAWAVPYGPATASGWSVASASTGVGFTGITNNSSFVPELTVVLRSAFSGFQDTVFNAELGVTKCAPMPTATQSPANSNQQLEVYPSVIAEYIQKFIWLLDAQVVFPPGHVYGKNGCKVMGRPVPSMCEWILQQVDFYGVLNTCLQYLIQLTSSAPFANQLITTDFIANYYFNIVHSLFNRVQNVGNPVFISATGCNTNLAPQSLWVHPCDNTQLDPAAVNVLQQIGPVYANGRLFLPQLTMNCFSTLASPSVVNYTNFPKFAFNTTTTTGQAACKGSSSGAGFASCAPFTALSAFWSSGTAKGPNVYSGGGTSTVMTLGGGQQSIYSAAGNNAATVLTNTMALATVGGAVAVPVTWYQPTQQISAGVNSYFSSNQVGTKFLASVIQEVAGGPQMFGHVVKVPSGTSTGVTGAAFQASVYYDNSSAGLGSSVIALYDPWTLLYVKSCIPLGPAESALAMGLSIITTYLLAASTVASYIRGELYQTQPQSGTAGGVRNNFISEFAATAGPLKEAYVQDRLRHGQGVGIYGDCWKRALFGTADALSGALQSQMVGSMLNDAVGKESPALAKLAQRGVSEFGRILHRYSDHVKARMGGG